MISKRDTLMGLGAVVGAGALPLAAFAADQPKSSAGVNSAPEIEQTPEATVADNHDIITLDDPRFKVFFEARKAYWSRLGRVEDDVIAYILSPQFTGAPAWPTTRQAFFIIRTPDSVIIASDGLSDLFVDTKIADAGFECEVYIETDALVGASFEQIRDSWAFGVIESFARNVADWGGINAKLDRYGVLSTQLPVTASLPRGWLDDDDSVGVLVNIAHPARPEKLMLDGVSEIKIVSVTLITTKELNYVARGGAAAREQIVKQLKARTHPTLSSVRRAELV